MRSRRTAQDEMAAVARRRLELLGAELAAIRHPALEEPPPDEAVEPSWGLEPPDPEESPDAPWFWDGDPSPHRLDEDDDSGLGGPWGELPLRGRHARRPVSAAGRVGGWVHDRLPSTLQGRVRLTAGHLSTVALLVAAAFAVTAWWVVRADAGEAVAPVSTWSADDPAGASASPEPLVTPVADPSEEAAADAEPAVVVVDVAGKVRHPGIATLPVGSRVVDAIEAAGGVRRGVDLTTLNLARVLVDGEQILVGIRAPGGVAASAASGGGATSGGVDLMVNINAATQSELEELPGVGPVTAAAILQWRQDNGPFSAVDELLEVSGIGEATLAEVAPFVTL